MLYFVLFFFSLLVNPSFLCKDNCSASASFSIISYSFLSIDIWRWTPGNVADVSATELPFTYRISTLSFPLQSCRSRMQKNNPCRNMTTELYREWQLWSGHEGAEIRYMNGSSVAGTSASSPGVSRHMYSKIFSDFWYLGQLQDWGGTIMFEICFLSGISSFNISRELCLVELHSFSKKNLNAWKMMYYLKQCKSEKYDN